MKSTNPRDAAYIFRDYARRIHVKSDPKDPSFLKLAVSCGHVSLPPHRHEPYTGLTSATFSQIEMWCEANYPSFVSAPSQPGQGPVVDPNDRRSAVIALDEKRDKELLELQRLAKAAGGNIKDAVKPRVKTTAKETHWDLILFMILAMAAVLGLGMGISWFVINKVSPDS